MFLFLLGADWSGALVRPGFAGPWRLVLSQMALSRNYVGVVRGRCARVMGACSAACAPAAASDVSNHLPHNSSYMGSREVHSDVGLVSAGEEIKYPVGRVEPCGGGGPRCCFGMFRVRMG
jgi:hypothetical protein